jgi:hypothetical protein
MAGHGGQADARRGACRRARGHHRSAAAGLPASAGRAHRAIPARAGTRHAPPGGRTGRRPAPARLVRAGRGRRHDRLAIGGRADAAGNPAAHAPSAGRRGCPCVLSGLELSDRQLTSSGRDASCAPPGSDPAGRLLADAPGRNASCAPGGSANGGAARATDRNPNLYITLRGYPPTKRAIVSDRGIAECARWRQSTPGSTARRYDPEGGVRDARHVDLTGPGRHVL